MATTRVPMTFGLMEQTTRPKKKKAATPRGAVRIDKVDGNWFIGTVTYNGKKFVYNVKAWPQGSDFGINKGGVSKLILWTEDGNNKITWVVNYDRGWDIKPKGKDVVGAYNLLLRKFNNGFSAPVLARYNRGY